MPTTVVEKLVGGIERLGRNVEDGEVCLTMEVELKTTRQSNCRNQAQPAPATAQL